MGSIMGSGSRGGASGAGGAGGWALGRWSAMMRGHPVGGW